MMRSGMGDHLKMFDVAKVLLFILPCAFLFGLTIFLFRDQIGSRRLPRAQSISAGNS
jgi:hypothetical protein